MPKTTSHSYLYQRGFTLIEILVSIVIIGVIVGGATLMFGDPGQDIIKEERARITMLVQLAQEESVMQSYEFALGFWEKGYSFYELSDKVDENGKKIWTKLDDDFLKEREIKEGLKQKLILEGRKTILDSTPDKEPQIFFMSSGETTPFELVLEYEERLSTTITVDALGRLELGELSNELDK